MVLNKVNGTNFDWCVPLITLMLLITGLGYWINVFLAFGHVQ